MTAVLLLCLPGAAALFVAAPAETDLRPRFAALGLTPRSQGPRGTCSLFAMTGVLEFELAQPGVRLSPEYLNWASHGTNGRRTDGSFFADALRGIEQFGVCREELMPYAVSYDAAVAAAPAARADASMRRNVQPVWIKQWNPNTGLSASQLAAIRQSLAEGHPVAAGMRWPRQEQYLPGDVLFIPPPEDVFDGHSVVLVGYRDDPRQPGGGTLLFRNAAGPEWRDAGYARLPYAYALAYVNDALALRVKPGPPADPDHHGRTLLEAEALRVIESRDCALSIQSMAPWGADRWSGGRQLFCGSRPGSSVTFALPVGQAGRFRLDLSATRAPDFGTLRVFLDERLIGQPFEGYAADVTPVRSITLGTVYLAAGSHRLRFEVTGKHEASKGFYMGLDRVELVPAEP